MSNSRKNWKKYDVMVWCTEESPDLVDWSDFGDDLGELEQLKPRGGMWIDQLKLGDEVYDCRLEGVGAGCAMIMK